MSHWVFRARPIRPLTAKIARPEWWSDRTKQETKIITQIEIDEFDTVSLCYQHLRRKRKTNGFSFIIRFSLECDATPYPLRAKWIKSLLQAIVLQTATQLTTVILNHTNEITNDELFPLLTPCQCSANCQTATHRRKMGKAFNATD